MPRSPALTVRPNSFFHFPHQNQHDVSKAVMMKFGHGVEIGNIGVAFKNFLDAGFQLFRQLPDLGLQISVPGFGVLFHWMVSRSVWAWREWEV